VSLRRFVGWPLRRVLDPRVAWTVAEVDARLGSQGNARPPIHERLDRLDEAIVRLDVLSARVEGLAQQIALDRTATDEGLSAILESLRQLHAELDAQAGPPAGDGP
jgi:hypothetical protein